MIKVKFFGLIRLQTGIIETQVDAKTVKEVLFKINEKYPQMAIKELKRKVIFVNGKNITDLKMFRTQLQDDDELTIMSPVSGG